MVKALVACAGVLVAGCSDSSKSSGKAEGSAAPPAESAKPPIDAAAAQPAEAATVVSSSTRSASGKLEVTGAITGTFEWRKQQQRAPISCAWDGAKEIGGIKVDVSDGAGKILTLAIDIPPSDAGSPRLDVSSKDLPAPLKTAFGFNVSGEDASLITVKFVDAKLGDEKKPDLTIKGTLEVSCPKKK